MIPLLKTVSRFGHAALLAGSVALPGVATAGPPLPDKPLYVGGGVAPLTMLTMSRSHKLYYEAYDDASDINGDGQIDTHYKPTEIDYFGYFDSRRCYTYDDSNELFEVSSKVADSNTKTCAGSSEWSGDFLNYLTTSRMDALRKTLYGGKRVVDTTNRTVVERAYIPQDAHSWGKEYSPNDNYDITDYSPLSAVSNRTERHLFASTNAASAYGVDDADPPKPLLRYVEDNGHRIWNWVSTERPVADEDLSNPDEDISGDLTDRTVRVEVCTTPLDEDGDGQVDDYEDVCKKYTDDSGNVTWKPTGLLHDFGETDRMKFGLMTGSYEKNYSGGVLRRTISSFAEEVNADTGILEANVEGIVHTIDSLRTVRFNTSDTGNYEYKCGFHFDSQRDEGECQNWGNPVAEMMYETLRYFSGKGSPTGSFTPSDDSAGNDTLGLPSPSWDDPYASSGGEPECSRAFQLALSDINPTFDSDQLPGSSFGDDFSGDSNFDGDELDVADQAQAVWNSEVDEGAISSPVFVGETTGNPDGAPTAKSVSSFGDMRGLAPEEPTMKGSYYAASVARFGKRNDLNPADDKQGVDTFSVALSSPLPRIRVPVGSGSDESIITIVPFAKSVGSTNADNRGIDSSEGAFQATDAIVDFYVEEFENLEPGSSGPAKASFRINYEDSEMGTDNDMDAIVRYVIQETPDGELEVTLESEYAAGDLNQHLGYVIRGTSQDGIYLEVRDEDTPEDKDDDYFLDTPDGEVPPNQDWTDDEALPKSHTRTFSPGTTNSGQFPRDPLWYAAKYGGFIDSNDNLEPDVESEWDDDGDGDPDNYFFVANAGELGAQLTKAFEEILAVVGSASSVAVNSTKLDSSTVTYQATFNSESWEGDLKAFEFDGSGGLASTPVWSAKEQLPAPGNRNIHTLIDTGSSQNDSAAFDWSALTAAEKSTLQDEGVDETVVDYIRGNQDDEKQNGGTLRNRDSLIGDIIDSSPEFVGQQNFGYALLDDGEGDAYRAYLNDKDERERAVFVGANDGMLHAFNAGNYDSTSATFDQGTGKEIFGYVPEAVRGGLAELTQPSYEHQYYVNGSLFAGDAYIDRDGSGKQWHTVLTGAFAHGHKGIFALDVAESGSSELKVNGANPDETPMWEFTPDNIDDGDHADELGHILGEPQIVRLADGTYAAVFGNGYNSTNGDATLFVVDLETGQPIETDKQGTDGVMETESGGNNGLATPFIVDKNGDRNADFAYAGDLKGNMWKFNLDPTSNDFGVAHKDGNTPAPLFRALGPENKEEQPITSKPVIGVPPEGRDGVMVYFGTGQYFAVGDSTLPSEPQIQSVYGIHDDNNDNKTPDAKRQGDTVSHLVKQKIAGETTGEGESARVRQISDNEVDYSNEDIEGWHLDLVYNDQPKGEQVVSSPILRFGRLSITTFTPTEDPCEFGGTSWFQQVDALSGSRLDESAIDVNNDGVIDEDDRVLVDDDDELDPVSGRQLGGVTAQPVVINDSGKDRAVFSKVCDSQDCDKTETELTQGGGLSVGRQSWRELEW